MEFKFNVSEIFPGPIVEINQTLIPPGFTGDRRALWDVVTKVSEIVNSMGDASATAQGLTKPITSADRLRNSEQTIYLLVDRHAKGGKGVVTGMLKTGKKSLYVFDRDGHHYQVSPPCVLDFYVHESRQRTGLGKQLFEHMLHTEKVEPVKMAVDRPSEKLLSFLDKHYNLNSALRQMNNYVVFDGFFPEPLVPNINGDGSNSGSPIKSKQSANGLQPNFSSPYGRYGAPRPPCSMGQIIHNQSPVQSNEPSGVSLNLKSKDVTQSTPAMQHQRKINSNQGYADVCQSAPNVPYPQTQQSVDPNVGQQNVQCYGESNMMPQQQQSMPQQQANMYPYSNMQHQNQQPNTHHQHQYPNMQSQQLNIQSQQLNMQDQQLNSQGQQLNTQGQQLNIHGQQLNIQGQQLNMQSQQLNTPHYQQQIHQQQNMQQYQQENMLQQQHLQPNIHYKPPKNGISPREGEQLYHEELYMQDPYQVERVQQHRQVASQPNMPGHQQPKHLPVHPMTQHISQQQFAQTATSYPAMSTQYEQMQAAEQQPQQYYQPPGNQTTVAPQRAGGTGLHQHMVTSPQITPSQQMIKQHQLIQQPATQATMTHQQMVTPQGTPHQEMLTQQQALPSNHVDSHQMVSPQQTVSSHHTPHSHHYQQMVSSHQKVSLPHSPHSHHPVHSQQMVSTHQNVSPQHTPHSHHSQQMVTPHQKVSPPHTPHSHHPVHSQQMVSTHQNVSPPHSPHSYHPVHSQQMVSTHQNVSPPHSPHSHHPVHSQQMVSTHQNVSPQHTPHAHHSQQMVTTHQKVLPPHTPHSHHPVHSQQVVSPHQNVSPPHSPHSQQMVSRHHNMSPPHSPHSHRPIHSQQMISPHQNVSPQHTQHSHHPQQMVTPHQKVSPPHSPHLHHPVHSQQMVSQHQNASPQHTPQSHHPVHSQQMVSQHQNTSPRHSPHSHHHVHSQQMVSSQPSAPHQQVVGPGQPYLQTAQPQSMPTVTPAQQQLPQLQSMPALQPTHGTVQYQQYIQPPNTEQPVQRKPQYVAAPQTNITSEQSAPRVPYQYYDSSSATMQTGYSQPHASTSRTAQNVHSSQIPYASGDMSMVQKSPDYYQGQQNISGQATPSGQVLSTSRTPIHVPRKRIVERETVGSLLQDQSGQMSDNSMRPQGPNGPQIASQ